MSPAAGDNHASAHTRSAPAGAASCSPPARPQRVCRNGARPRCSGCTPSARCREPRAPEVQRGRSAHARDLRGSRKLNVSHTHTSPRAVKAVTRERRLPQGTLSQHPASWLGAGRPSWGQPTSAGVPDESRVRSGPWPSFLFLQAEPEMEWEEAGHPAEGMSQGRVNKGTGSRSWEEQRKPHGEAGPRGRRGRSGGGSH